MKQQKFPNFIGKKLNKIKACTLSSNFISIVVSWFSRPWKVFKCSVTRVSSLYFKFIRFLNRKTLFYVIFLSRISCNSFQKYMSISLTSIMIKHVINPLANSVNQFHVQIFFLFSLITYDGLAPLSPKIVSSKIWQHNISPILSFQIE